MHCVSFDIFRTLGFPDTTVLKPDQFLRHKELLRDADWVLFPEYWQLNALVHGLKCRVFPSIASYRIGHDKVEMIRAFQAIAPEHTPWTLITANGPQEREQIWQEMALPFVAKLPKSSMGEGVWLIENRAFCCATASRCPDTSSWRSGSNSAALSCRYRPSSRNTRARLCCTGWLANSICQGTDSALYQAAPATKSKGSRHRCRLAFALIA